MGAQEKTNQRSRVMPKSKIDVTNHGQRVGNHFYDCRGRQHSSGTHFYFRESHNTVNGAKWLDVVKTQPGTMETDQGFGVSSDAQVVRDWVDAALSYYEDGPEKNRILKM